tara:strand:+ start:113 stop:703 length:591 start_codon:yes stop_codon:yes gene_type:complete
MQAIEKNDLKTFINNEPKHRESPSEGVEIIDNFLTNQYVTHLQNIFFNRSFPWCYSPFVGYNLQDTKVSKEERDSHLYFIHRIYEELRPIEDSFQTFDQFLPILEALKIRSLVRIRALLYVNQGKLIKHEKHRDAAYPIKAALLYLNDSNGYTGFEDGTKVESVCNRLALFDGSTYHHSTTCTDAKERLVININYF